MEPPTETEEQRIAKIEAIEAKRAKLIAKRKADYARVKAKRQAENPTPPKVEPTEEERFAAL